MLLLAGWRARWLSSLLLSCASAVGSRLPVPPPSDWLLLLFLAFQRNRKSFVVIFLVCPTCLLPVFLRTSSNAAYSTARSLFKSSFNCFPISTALRLPPRLYLKRRQPSEPGPASPLSVQRRGPGPAALLLSSLLFLLGSVFAKHGLIFCFCLRSWASVRPSHTPLFCFLLSHAACLGSCPFV